jgi:short-subunit dehydrogenase
MEQERAATNGASAESLTAVGIFTGCVPSELAEVATALQGVSLGEGTIIFSPGDAGDAMYVVRSGSVRITSDIETEKEILAHLGPGQIFGEMALMTGAPRSAAAVAVSDVELWRLGRDAFERIVREYPQVSIEVNRLLKERAEREKTAGRDLKGRTAIVTGASKGIGIYIAQALAAEGTNIVLAARSAEKLEEVRSGLKDSGVSLLAVPSDVGKLDDLKSLVERTNAEFGKVDVVVNNAGYQMTLAYHMLTLDEIEELMKVNLAAPMLLSWLVLPGMLERGWGHIVQISSLMARAGSAYSEPYAATKAGLVGFTQSFRASYRGSGVSASVIVPGFVESGIYSRSKKAGLRASRLIGSSKPEAVSAAVVRAIKKDLPEVIVNPGPMRLMLALSTLSPGISEGVRRRIGADQVFHKAAAIRGRRRAEPKFWDGA